MFCDNCGNKIQQGHKFCMTCGQTVSCRSVGETSANHVHDQKWWFRLVKVLYIVFYIPLPFVIWGVWAANSETYNYYTRKYTSTVANAFWYSLLTLIIYVVVLRLLKITFLYIAFGQRVYWHKEFKKIF
jgi:uncharacterized membrane protein YvbJ